MSKAARLRLASIKTQKNYKALDLTWFVNIITNTDCYERNVEIRSWKPCKQFTSILSVVIIRYIYKKLGGSTMQLVHCVLHISTTSDRVPDDRFLHHIFIML